MINKIFPLNELNEASRAVAFIWLILPFLAFVVYTVYRWIIDFCCGDHEDFRLQEIQMVQSSSAKAIAPILTRLPPNFRFANYITENESVSSDWPSTALSLNRVIHVPSLLLIPCCPCVGVRHNRVKSKLVEVDVTIPADERPSSITKHSAKMTQVAEWLLARTGGDSNQVQAETRGAALLTSVIVREGATWLNQPTEDVPPLRNSQATCLLQV